MTNQNRKIDILSSKLVAVVLGLLFFLGFPSIAFACLDLPDNPPDVTIVGDTDSCSEGFLVILEDFQTYGASQGDDYCACALNIPARYGWVQKAEIVYANTMTPIPGFSFERDFDTSNGFNNLAPAEWEGFSSSVSQAIDAGTAVDIVFHIVPFKEGPARQNNNRCEEDIAQQFATFLEEADWVIGSSGADEDGNPDHHTSIQSAGQITVQSDASLSVAINGPNSGTVNTTYFFNSIVSPDSAALPLVHDWRADDQAPATNVGGITDTVSYMWSEPGVKVITVGAINENATASATHTITIQSDAPTSVAISGPTSGTVNTTYFFSSTVSPSSATTPLVHDWRADDQAPATNVGGLTDTVSYMWSEPGVKVVTVEVVNENGTANATHTITIDDSQPPIDIILYGPDIAATGNHVWSTANIQPLEVTLPITYYWEASGQTPISIVRESTNGYEWMDDLGWSNQWAYANFIWDTAGRYNITLTVSNEDGTISATRAITVMQSPEVILSGPTSGQINTEYLFEANVSPDTTHQPINYSWYHSDGSWRNQETGLSHNFTMTWPTAGTKAVQMYVWNNIGWDEDILLFDIPIPALEFTPTIQSTTTGAWDDPNTWDMGHVPLETDVVLIQPGHVVRLSTPITVESLVNHGSLLSNGDLKLHVTDALSNTGTIRSGIGVARQQRSTRTIQNHTPACDGTSGTWGGDIVLTGGTLVHSGTTIASDGASGGRGGHVTITSTISFQNTGMGIIQSGNGGNGAPGSGGGPGGRIEITSGPPVSGNGFTNDGTIQAGHGGDGDQCGGEGGSFGIFSQDSINGLSGIIQAGHGGNTTDDSVDAHAGDGGDGEFWGKWFMGGGSLINLGTLEAGNGGDGHPSAVSNPQDAGCGGDLTLMGAPNVTLFGTQNAGQNGTPSAGGDPCNPGNLWIDPGTISFSEESRISGHDVNIYGDDWTLDMKNLSPNAISATGNVVLATGPGGTVDLRGNSGPIFAGPNLVTIYSDEILLDEGVPLQALSDAQIVTDTARILRNVSAFFTPSDIAIEPGSTASIRLQVANSSPTTDTFTLSFANSDGWSMDGLPESVTIGGLEHQEIDFSMTAPVDVPVDTVNEIQVSVLSQSDPEAVSDAEMFIVVEHQEDGASISGTKWNDLDNDGAQDDSEPGLEGWTILLESTAEDTSRETTTDANGRYSFVELDPGTYLVSEEQKPGWSQTYPEGAGVHEVSVDAGESIEGVDFGNQREFVKGDGNCDGSVGALDALRVLQFVVRIIQGSDQCQSPQTEPVTIYLPGCDANDDGTCSLLDGLAILLCTVGIPSDLCPVGSTFNNEEIQDISEQDDVSAIQGATTLYINLPAITAGDTFTATVVADSAARLNAAEVSISYDRSQFRILDCQVSQGKNSNKIGICNANYQEGVALFNIAMSSGEPGSMNLADITFEHIGDTVRPSIFDLDVPTFIDRQGNSVAVTVEDGVAGGHWIYLPMIER